MEALFRTTCFDGEVLVRQQNDGTFDMAIQADSTPFGGNRLGKYTSEEEATRKAKHFCRLYAIVREKGYYLSGSVFTKPDREAIPVAILLNLGITEQQLAHLVDNSSEPKSTNQSG